MTKFCIQLSMLKTREDVCLQKETKYNCLTELKEITNEIIHMLEAFVHATHDKNMEIHIHLKEQTND